MSDKLKNDSTKTMKPIIFQFLIALEKCFEMRDGQSIWIEKYGDVTISNKEQIEVKNYQKDLTDLDPNIWKTLKNWLDDKFDICAYHHVILLTTQTISKNSKFFHWNEVENRKKKLEILKSIKSDFDTQKKKGEETQKLLEAVFDSSKRSKLLEILDKFIIRSEHDNDKNLYTKMIETRTDGVLKAKKKEYIAALLGYILNPEITSNGWEIKNKEFRKKTKSLIETYTSTTKIFPKVEMKPVTNESLKNHQSYLFVKKIDDIKYDEVKKDAISDFINARRTTLEELKDFSIKREEHDSYETTIMSSFKAKRRIASRNVNSSNSIDKAQDLYDTITSDPVPNFYNFNDIPPSYRNGLLHEIANDDENPTKVVWKLEIGDE